MIIQLRREERQSDSLMQKCIEKVDDYLLTLFFWDCSSALPLTAGICSPLWDPWSGGLQDGGKRRESVKRGEYENHWDE